MRIEFSLKRLLILLVASMALVHCHDDEEESPAVPEFEITQNDVLSENGAIRSTAYSMSNKIVTANGKIFATWLEDDLDVMIGAYDIATEEWGDPVFVGSVADGQSGPALAIDGNGILHIIFGGYFAPFEYVHSLAPFDISAWSTQEQFGDNANFPSFVVGADDALHLVYRGDTRVMYQKRTSEGVWLDPIVVVDPQVTAEFATFGATLAIDESGNLHIGFHIFDLEPRGGKFLGYMRSRDDGNTWENAASTAIALPATKSSDVFVEQGVGLDLRIGNLVVDAVGNPWMTAIHFESNSYTRLWTWNGTAWVDVNIDAALQQAQPDRRFAEAVLTFDEADILYVLGSSAPIAVMEADTGENYPAWGHPTLEIDLLTSFDRLHFNVQRVSKTSDSDANWLPSVERPSSARPHGMPSFFYQRGGRDDSDRPSDVIFHRLLEPEIPEEDAL